MLRPPRMDGWMDGYRADADGGDAAATAAASVDRGGGRKPGILI